MVKKVFQIEHPSVRESIRFLKLRRGISVQHVGDLPARSGMGSSSSFTVGLLHALHALEGKMVRKKQLAFEAIEVEQKRMKENVGSQDQITAAFGGLHKIEFNGENHIRIIQIIIDPKKIRFFHSHLMLFFTGLSRLATNIAGEQIQKIPQKKKELHRMYGMVQEGLDILNSGTSLDRFGKLLDESWKIKRTLSSKITNPKIDEVYKVARRAGAIGGKLLGAGGGGFILFFVKPQHQSRVREKLKKLLYVPFKFEELGSQIIYYKPDTNF